jgi:hypothetical protein
MPEDPAEAGKFPTGLMMNAPTPPSNLCSCQEGAKAS